MCVDTHEPQPGGNRGHGERKPHDINGGPNSIAEDIFLTLFTVKRGIVDAAGEFAHFPAEDRPQADGEYRPDRKEGDAEKPAFFFEELIFGDCAPVEPGVDGGMATENNAHQDHEADDADGDHGSRDGFGDTTEGDDKTAQGQRYGAEEEHGRIGNKQEVYTIVHEGCPETRALIMGTVQDETYNQRDHTHRHQAQGPLLVSGRYFEMFFIR